MLLSSYRIPFLIPYFVEMQRRSFLNFLNAGLNYEVSKKNPMYVCFKQFKITFYPEAYKLSIPEYTSKTAILKFQTYASKLYIPIEFTNSTTKELKLQWVLLATLPLMTKRGHFIVNGCPRVIVNQIVRSPGIYYKVVYDEKKRKSYYGDLISQRGAWLRFEIDKKKRVWVKIKKSRKIPILIFFKALGISDIKLEQSIKYTDFLRDSKQETQSIESTDYFHPSSVEDCLIWIYGFVYPEKKEKGQVTLKKAKKFLFQKFFNHATYDLGHAGRNQLNQKFNSKISKNILVLTPHDLLCAVNYLIKVEQGIGVTDDIDDLKNRRVRTSGELLQNQIGTGFIRLEKFIKNKTENPTFNVSKIFSSKPVDGALREFFGSSPLSQFMDQTNPLAELTHKRRISSLGPGGVSRETAGMQVRGIHVSHYGRICPIETPEGRNAGLVNSLTTLARINKQGFIETPFYPVYQGQIQKFGPTIPLSAIHESQISIAASDLQTNYFNFLPCRSIPARSYGEFQTLARHKIQYMSVSPIQMISIATSLIPFLEHDDANRALMGSNMQRQAVPLVLPERPVVGTGLETRVVADSGHGLQAKTSGVVVYTSSKDIRIKNFFSPSEVQPTSSGHSGVKTKFYALHKTKVGRPPSLPLRGRQGGSYTDPSSSNILTLGRSHINPGGKNCIFLLLCGQVDPLEVRTTLRKTYSPSQASSPNLRALPIVVDPQEKNLAFSIVRDFENKKMIYPWPFSGPKRYESPFASVQTGQKGGSQSDQISKIVFHQKTNRVNSSRTTRREATRSEVLPTPSSSRIVLQKIEFKFVKFYVKFSALHTTMPKQRKKSLLGFMQNKQQNIKAKSIGLLQEQKTGIKNMWVGFVKSNSVKNSFSRNIVNVSNFNINHTNSKDLHFIQCTKLKLLTSFTETSSADFSWLGTEKLLPLFRNINLLPQSKHGFKFFTKNRVFGNKRNPHRIFLLKKPPSLPLRGRQAQGSFVRKPFNFSYEVVSQNLRTNLSRRKVLPTLNFMQSIKPRSGDPSEATPFWGEVSPTPTTITSLKVARLAPSEASSWPLQTSNLKSFSLPIQFREVYIAKTHFLGLPLRSKLKINRLQLIAINTNLNLPTNRLCFTNGIPLAYPFGVGKREVVPTLSFMQSIKPRSVDPSEASLAKQPPLGPLGAYTQNISNMLQILGICNEITPKKPKTLNQNLAISSEVLLAISGNLFCRGKSSLFRTTGKRQNKKKSHSNFLENTSDFIKGFSEEYAELVFAQVFMTKKNLKHTFLFTSQNWENFQSTKCLPIRFLKKTHSSNFFKSSCLTRSLIGVGMTSLVKLPLSGQKKGSQLLRTCFARKTFTLKKKTVYTKYYTKNSLKNFLISYNQGIQNTETLTQYLKRNFVSSFWSKKIQLSTVDKRYQFCSLKTKEKKIRVLQLLEVPLVNDKKKTYMEVRRSSELPSLGSLDLPRKDLTKVTLQASYRSEATPMGAHRGSTDLGFMQSIKLRGRYDLPPSQKEIKKKIIFDKRKGNSSFIQRVKEDLQNRRLDNGNKIENFSAKLVRRNCEQFSLNFFLSKTNHRFVLPRSVDPLLSQKGGSLAREVIPTSKTQSYKLGPYQHSNQNTCLHQVPLVSDGEWVQKGDLLTDGASSVGGELSLGKSISVAYMPWEGYNFEDAILVSERLIYDDLYTSIHIEKYTTEISDTPYGREQITAAINVSVKQLFNLDKDGIVKLGTWVTQGDILVGKLTPIRERKLSGHEKLLSDVLGMKKNISIVKDTSLRVPKYISGRVVHIEKLENENISSNSLPGMPSRVHIYIAEKKKVQVGDKMSGRHGNKGIISKILPRQDMPYLADGTPIDMVLNPLGVPSRMNVGQIFECLLGLAAKELNQQFKISCFDEMNGAEASRSFTYSKLFEARVKTGKRWLFQPNFPGKMELFDGRTGECFHQSVTVGKPYMLKLIHLVDEKIHARSTGPYSLVTQQPVRGRSKQGGQRLGEMEVWALEGFGAAYTLQELLTMKSDDIEARHQVIQAILERKSISVGTPESFKVLLLELQSLCLHIGVYSISNTGNRQRINSNYLF